jgi:hypothetical protein
MIMKKNVLAMSVAAALGVGVAGSAVAVETVGDSGIGHKLYVPYFTTQNGNATLINISNTDPTNGKAVKVRFRSGVDSDDIFDFQVFLSPSDVWTASITQGAGGLSTLTTNDKTCTLPSSVNQSFVTARLADYVDAAGTHSVAEQTREGYIEIFNMADIPPKLANGAAGGYTASTSTNPLFTAIKHVAGVAPCTSATLLGIEAVGGAVVAPVLATASGGTIGAANYAVDQEVFPPTATLMGDWVIINVPSTLTYSGAMPAIKASSQTIVSYSGQSGTGRTATHLAAVNANVFPGLSLTEDGVLLNQTQTGVITADYDFPDMSTPYEPNYADTPYNEAHNLSIALLHGAVTNEFMTDSDVAGGTDWVMTLPTRRYHVAGRGVNYGAAGDANGYPATESIEGIAGGVTGFLATAFTYAGNGRSSCWATGGSPMFYDR